MEYRYVYKPEKEKIYLYKDKPVTYHYGSGQIVLFDLQGRYVDDYPQYSNQDDQVSEESIGMIIRPRWNKEYLKWELLQRGLKHEQIVLDGSH